MCLGCARVYRSFTKVPRVLVRAISMVIPVMNDLGIALDQRKDCQRL